MGLKESFYYRAKSFVEKENLNRTIGRNALDNSYLNNVSIELLETMETMKNFKKDATCLIDIGAHKGLFAKTANAFFAFSNTVCFEPNRELNNEIKANNTKTKGLLIENVALSSSEGTVTFYLHQDNTMNSIVEAEKEVLGAEFPWDDPKLMKETTVPTTTLDTYIEKQLPGNAQLVIKIDTQGNELNVLKYGLHALKRTEICIIEHMFTNPYKSDYTFYDLIRFMDENNFDCRGALNIAKRPSKKISAVDFIFVRKDLIK